MKKLVLIACIALLPLALAVLLLIGIETRHREHDTEYTLFVKQHPSLQVFFNNPIVCGECDVETYEKLPLSRLEEIRTYCRQRFDLSNLRMCHAIFAESQRQARSGSQSLDAIMQVAARFINNSNIENNTNYAFPSASNKVFVPECALPLGVKWREDADRVPRINVSCEQTGRPAPQDRWDVMLPIVPN